LIEAFTDDTLLGGRVTLRQPRNGFRATSDAVFLAAALTAAPGEKLLDVGVGAGAALLAAAARMPACNFVGIDTDAEALGYARYNVATNGWADRVVLSHTDLADIAAVPAPAYHHAFSNPPYYAREYSQYQTRYIEAEVESVWFRDKARRFIQDWTSQRTGWPVHQRE